MLHGGQGSVLSFNFVFITDYHPNKVDLLVKKMLKIPLYGVFNDGSFHPVFIIDTQVCPNVYFKLQRAGRTQILCGVVAWKYGFKANLTYK